MGGELKDITGNGVLISPSKGQDFNWPCWERKFWLVVGGQSPLWSLSGGTKSRNNLLNFNTLCFRNRG